MKKTFAWILVLILIVSAAACAEQEESFFARFDGLEWWFSSGAGGWSTDLQIFPDGTFTGTYHDSEMGDAADEYPDGTLYICSFTGKLSLDGEPEDGSPWIIRIDELKVDEPAEREYIEDGIRFIYTEPYGISEGNEMTLYAPGTDVGAFTDDMLLWSHVLDSEDTVYELESWFLYSEADGSGFVAYPYES